MKIYFGKLDEDMAQEFEEAGSPAFKHAGYNYEYLLQTYGTLFSIEDTVGRKVPFDEQVLDSLIDALGWVKSFHTNVEYGEASLAILEDPTEIRVINGDKNDH